MKYTTGGQDESSTFWYGWHPKKLKKYADKKGYVIGESVKYKKRTLCIMKKANEESLLKSKIYELNNGKIKRIFQFN